MSSTRPAIEDIYFRVRDGLKLHVKSYKAAQPTGRPVLCLPGLTRNGRDFHDLALHLSTNTSHSRDVFTFDYRGRGLSQWDSDWKNYNVITETLDVLDFMTSIGLHDAAIIGTSRGGLISMFMAALQPTSIGSIILNDIGPVVETDGIMRIAGYVGLIPLPRDWTEAVTIIKQGNRRNFPNIKDEEWAIVARQWYNEKNDRPSCGYDPKLKNTLSVLDGPMPELWPQFEALKRVPLLVLRGENSDILSNATVEEMHRHHPAIRSRLIAKQGHAPLLRDKDTMEDIAQFLLETDNGGKLRVEAATSDASSVATVEKPKPQAANDDRRPSVVKTILSGTTGG